MKIELVIFTNHDEGEYRHLVNVDGKEVAGIQNLNECPEDATLGRDLISGHQIAGFIKMGYDAALRGETFEITERPSNEDD